MSLEDRLAKFLEQPGTFITSPEKQFIADMRRARALGVGYGWMQQVIEWEWQSKGPGSFGPEYFEKRIRELEGKPT
jgi:hypothetical protein